MTNNVPEMLWQTFAFVIQFYIAALTLGTMLNYLVRTHILRISCYLSPQLTRDLPTTVLMLQYSLCWWSDIDAIRKRKLFVRLDVTQLKTLIRNDWTACDNTWLPRAFHPNYTNELFFTFNFNIERTNRTPCRKGVLYLVYCVRVNTCSQISHLYVHIL